MIITADQIKLSDKITQVYEANLFKDSDYLHWCSSVIKGEDGKYHLIYSR